MRVKGKVFSVHRISAAIFLPDFVDELCVLHICDVRNCVRPSHLFMGTMQDNTIDAVNKGKWNKKGERNGRAKITKEIAEKIRAEALTGETQRALSSRYGICCSAISHIVTGRSWN
jgi:hypothetical protein